MVGRSFIRVFDYAQTMEDMLCEAQGGNDKKGLVTRVVSVKVEAAHISKAMVLKLGTLHISFIEQGSLQ